MFDLAYIFEPFIRKLLLGILGILTKKKGVTL